MCVMSNLQNLEEKKVFEELGSQSMYQAYIKRKLIEQWWKTHCKRNQDELNVLVSFPCQNLKKKRIKQYYTNISYSL